MSAYLIITLDLMKRAGSMNELSGEDKKAFVIDGLRKALELPEDIEELILAVIDALIDVEKGRLVLNPIVKETTSKCRHACWGFIKGKCSKSK